MKLNYDQEADVLSIDLSGEAIARTEQIDEGTLVDLDRMGQVVSIEVIRPARRWPLEQITGSFQLSASDVQVLGALWERDVAYPFSPAGGEPAVLA